jgi:branched-subunit amino acid aminotransferase/4-amino-4-deoxychorismate lyase
VTGRHEEHVERGVLTERVLSIDDLAFADGVFLLNSVRKWRRVRLEKP